MDTIGKFCPRPQSELARCLEDNELPEFLEVLGAAQEVGYNLDEHYGKEVASHLFYNPSFSPALRSPNLENSLRLLCRWATKPFCIWPLMRTTLTQHPLWRLALRWAEHHLCLRRDFLNPYSTLRQELVLGMSTSSFCPLPSTRPASTPRRTSSSCCSSTPATRRT